MIIEDDRSKTSPSLTFMFVLLFLGFTIGNIASVFIIGPHDWTLAFDRTFFQFTALICTRFALWMRGTQ